MPNLLVSLSNNLLKLSINTKNGFQSANSQIALEAVTGSQITDLQAFATQFSETLTQLIATNKTIKKQNLSLIFLVEPSDALLKFVTISKNIDSPIDDQIIANAKEKLADSNVNFDDLYFSYQKMAPFVYQFVAIKKDLLDTYLEVANLTGLSLKAVVPWVLTLPKHLDSNDPCVFVFNTQNRQAVALSELNGIYFSESFEKQQSLEEIRELVHNLSIYKRQTPINKVYTLTDNQFGLAGDYEVNHLLELSEDFAEAKDYELHLLVEDVLNKNEAFYQSHVNLLTLLPLPVVVQKNMALVYAGAVASSFMLVLAGFGIYNTINSQEDPDALAVDTQNINNVLSDQDTLPVTNDDDDAVELTKEDITIRVENGAGVAGVAGTTRDFLEGLGYTVVGVGNASNTGYTQTVLNFKKSKVAYTNLLSDDMKKDFDIVVEDSLDEDTEHDVLVTVGAN